MRRMETCFIFGSIPPTRWRTFAYGYAYVNSRKTLVNINLNQITHLLVLHEGYSIFSFLNLKKKDFFWQTLGAEWQTLGAESWNSTQDTLTYPLHHRSTGCQEPNFFNYRYCTQKYNFIYCCVSFLSSFKTIVIQRNIYLCSTGLSRSSNII